MKTENIIPACLVIFMILSAIIYACKKNWAMAIYWFCGGMLNFAVTFMK